MYYYTIGRDGSKVVLNSIIGQRDIIILGNIIGIKLGNDIYYREKSEFWIKNVLTGEEKRFTLLDDIVSNEAVGFFENYIAIENKANGNPEFTVCSLYDYQGMKIEHDSSAEIRERVKEFLKNQLIDVLKYSQICHNISKNLTDWPSFDELIGDESNEYQDVFNYDYVMDLVGRINKGGILKKRAADNLFEYCEMLLLFDIEDFALPLINIMALSNIPLTMSCINIYEENALSDNTKLKRIKKIIDKEEMNKVISSLYDLDKLRNLYESI